MSQRARSVNTRSAQRLAHTIGTLRSVLIVLVITVATAVAVTAPADSLVILSLVYGAAAAICVYVTFGWLEHTLSLLVDIAHNTADRAQPLRHPES